MSRHNHRVIALGFAIALMSSMANAQPETEHAGESFAVTPAKAKPPFTRIAYIPAGSDLSSITFQGIKPVRIATKSRSTTDTHYCQEAAFRDPGGSMFCPYTKLDALVPAYQATYVFNGQPLASDEYGNRKFTFSVYIRPEELRPEVLKLRRADVAALFELTTFRTPEPRVVIDESKSTFCEGTYVDGSWTPVDRRCEDTVNYKTIPVASDYITVRVDPAPSRAEQASRSIGRK
jgi:hypothetical protein